MRCQGIGMCFAQPMTGPCPHRWAASCQGRALETLPLRGSAWTRCPSFKTPVVEPSTTTAQASVGTTTPHTAQDRAAPRGTPWSIAQNCSSSTGTSTPTQAQACRLPAIHRSASGCNAPAPPALQRKSHLHQLLADSKTTPRQHPKDEPPALGVSSSRPATACLPATHPAADGAIAG